MYCRGKFEMSLKSKISIARPGSPSLRATVPEGIVAFLNLKEGDNLEWKMEIIDGKRIAMVQKASFDDEAARIALKYVKSRKK
jgi:hypothetical protein